MEHTRRFPGLSLVLPLRCSSVFGFGRMLSSDSLCCESRDYL
jgi:hypothetical protein